MKKIILRYIVAIVFACIHTLTLSAQNTNALDEVQVVGSYPEFHTHRHPTPYDLGQGLFYNEIELSKDLLGVRKRLIIKPCLIECDNEDVIVYLDPIVINGKKYDASRKRLADGEKEDSLAAYVDHNQTIGKEDFTLSLAYSVRLPNPSAHYRLQAKVIIEDYTRTIYENVMDLSNCRNKEPMRFLEIPNFEFQLDPENYKERVRRERRNIKESFMADPECSELKRVLEKDSRIKELQIVSVASPEGNYTNNLILAEQRLERAKKWLNNHIPREKLMRIYMKQPVKRVATWEEMANLLEKDSLFQQAEEIRHIVKDNRSPDVQYAHIRNLSYYGTTIKERLPQLRKLQYDCTYEVFRELMPEEIMDRYLNDPEYHTGKKDFRRNDYWHLFQQIKDPKEAEKIFRRAYEETMSYNAKGEKEPWVLAANNLAAALLKRDTFDVEILKPLIDYTQPVNAETTFNDDFIFIKKVVNPEDVVANQVVMYIRAKRFWDACKLAKKLPDTDKFKLLKAFAYCLDGIYYFTKDEEERKEMFELVRNSSPMNNAVMCMAMNTDFYNAEARKVLEKLTPTTQVKYMKLQLFVRENNLTEEKALKEACRMLDEIIKEVPEYALIAENDGELGMDFIEYYNNSWRN